MTKGKITVSFENEEGSTSFELEIGSISIIFSGVQTIKDNPMIVVNRTNMDTVPEPKIEHVISMLSCVTGLADACNAIEAKHGKVVVEGVIPKWKGLGLTDTLKSAAELQSKSIRPFVYRPSNIKTSRN